MTACKKINKINSVNFEPALKSRTHIETRTLSELLILVWLLGYATQPLSKRVGDSSAVLRRQVVRLIQC